MNIQRDSQKTRMGDLMPHEHHDHKSRKENAGCHHQTHDTPKALVAEGDTIIYTCPMHSEIRQSFLGQCPICGMVRLAILTAWFKITQKSFEYGYLDCDRQWCALI